MNSVFSAFKSNKNNESKIKNLNNKKINVPDNSYENLRHIREIGSSSKMSTFVDDDDDECNLIASSTSASSLQIGKRCPTPIQPISPSFTLVEDADVVDCCTVEQQRSDIVEGVLKFNLHSNDNNDLSSSSSSPSSQILSAPTFCLANENSTEQNCKLNSSNRISSSLSSSSTLPLSTSSAVTTNGTSFITSSDKKNHVKSSVNGNKCSSDKINNSSVNNSFGSNRLNRPRLSLSGIGNNNTLPSVHGRQCNGNSTTTNGQHKTRLSTHQRNLSLDFRSMGILLPPVSQVTNTRINLTQHHRNRSLDSALQRIPEVEVSSPNADSENTLCTSSILGATMCSKIVPSSNNHQKQSPTVQDIIVCNNTKTITTNCSNISNDTIQDSEIVCKENESKKREDLTSLGSDDSGIICGSEPDQASLTRIRRSRESLDSGEIDPEEECIEIETQSMDEEYRMLQNDLCFYQIIEKDNCKTMDEMDDLVNDKLRYRDQNICDARKLLEENNPRNLVTAEIDDSEEEVTPTENDIIATPTQLNDEFKSITTNSSSTTTSDVPIISNNITNNNNVNNSTTNNTTNTTSTTATTTPPVPTNKKENEVIFRNFFGATKNAIFRTAQSIIENHEKKNSKNKNDSSEKDDVKSPVEISKKKEFFILKSSSSKNKTQNNNNNNNSNNIINNNNHSVTTPTVLTPETTPEIEIKDLSKSSSSTSLNKEKDKTKVPGVAHCLLPKEFKEPLSKTASGNASDKSSGLLRFFESPIFNIHFAIHYLFYSKEPGVLSFIGNKVFSFPNNEVDLYMPQLILMYIQMDELAEVLDPYLTARCRKSVDFSLKCAWLLEAYNYNIEEYYMSNASKKIQLNLMKELYPKKERKQLKHSVTERDLEMLSPVKKTHHRSQSDATGLLNDSRKSLSSSSLIFNPKLYQTPVRLCLGDLTTGRAFDNGCVCFESVRGTVNGLLGQKTFCHCGAPKLAAQKEFMKALIDIGKTLTQLPNKTEKNSRLRVLLNLINKNLPARVWLPLHSEIPHHIVRITEEKTAVLNSKDKTPYIIYVEVVEVNDIFSSPVIPKLMPSLRHTKSEERLDTNTVSTTPTPPPPPHLTSTAISLISQPVENGPTQQTLSSTMSLSKLPSTSNSSSNLQKEIQVRIEKVSECSNSNSELAKCELNELGITEDDVWSQEDDEITAQYLNLHKMSERDTLSQMSLDSCDSREQNHLMLFNIGDVRLRHCANLNKEYTKPFSNDPEDPSAAALKEPWHEKETQIRDTSPYGHLSNWRLLSAIVKCGDDLRQELMATQLLQMFKLIWQEENVELWVRPYKIVCLSNDSGLIEPILNTVSLHQIKKNSNKSLKDYFIDEYGSPEEDSFKFAQKNFMQSCAAYCLISYLLQVKDRHNGNILLHSDGHLIHIDFGFILSISPKNLGFEQSPFKLTPEFVEIMGGPSSELWSEFKYLLLKGLMAARKHMDRVINIVEIMRSSSQLPCFKNSCSGTVSNLRKRFHMNLTEQELERKVDQLVFDSLNSLSTKLYDGYQYFTNGIL